VTNILIAGVGGQGSLLASKVLGYLFLSAGCDVKVSEVHGMSQRGGSVVTTIRAGERVYSPLIPPGQADLLIALEQLEALRLFHMLKPEGKLAASEQAILPMTVLTGAAAYPEERPPGLWLPALELACKAGSAKAANIVLLGAAARFLPFAREAWREAIRACLPAKLHDVNITAFEEGDSYVLE
jgi:indolepyruvate ferredoxin oxidoreductase beta subunit